MSLHYEGAEYLVGPSISISLREHVGNVQYLNQNCPVFRDTSGDLYLRYQHLNTEWPTYYPLRTKAQVLEGWS